MHYKHIYSGLYQSLLLAHSFYSNQVSAEIAIYDGRTFGSGGGNIHVQLSIMGDSELVLTVCNGYLDRQTCFSSLKQHTIIKTVGTARLKGI